MNMLQLLFNNKTQLHLKSYPPIKDYNADLHNHNNSSHHSALIYIGDHYFDFQNCILKYLPSLNNSWFASVDLKEGCSSVEVIHSILKSAQTLNGSNLRGILFFVDAIPGAPSLHYLANRPGIVNCRHFVAFYDVPQSVRRCSGVLTSRRDNSPLCTVFLSSPTYEDTFLRSRLWIYRSQSISQSSPPSFPRHRLTVTSPDQYANQSVVRTEGVGGTAGGSAIGGGVINVEDAFLNRSSVLFVAVSFILLMFISLAWLVFYYVQRFRYLHSKERASRRLAELARKAVARIPLKLLQAGDKEIGVNGEHCAICIEPYRPFDNIRILPCRHYFHKLCIDPWLLEQRSCPMCKLDILQAYDFRPDMDRSCPASTGMDSNSTAPVATVPVPGPSADPSSSPLLVRAGVEHDLEEGERDEKLFTNMIGGNGQTRNTDSPECVTTASVSTSYHDLEHQSDGSHGNSGRRELLQGLFRSSSISNPRRHQHSAHRLRRNRSRNVEVVAASVEPTQSHLLSEDVENLDSNPPNITHLS
nr:goliath e3 ubiquitin ligase [Hymenolepis microstoma]